MPYLQAALNGIRFRRLIYCFERLFVALQYCCIFYSLLFLSILYWLSSLPVCLSTRCRDLECTNPPGAMGKEGGRDNHWNTESHATPNRDRCLLSIAGDPESVPKP